VILEKAHRFGDNNVAPRLSDGDRIVEQDTYVVFADRYIPGRYQYRRATAAHHKNPHFSSIRDVREAILDARVKINVICLTARDAC